MSNNNLFYLSQDPGAWYQNQYNPSIITNSFYEWQQLGKDLNSLKTNTGPLFVNASAGNFQMEAGTVAKGVGNLDYLNNPNPGMKIEKDYLGHYRSTTFPCAGAFELSSRTPYPGLPISIPGKIETEDFDNGEESEAYHDETTGNAGNCYRIDTDVDIYQEADSIFVQSELSSPREYLKYTVNVKSSGTYRIEAKVGTVANITRTFQLYINDIYTATYTFTGSAFHTGLVAANITLSSGIKDVEIRFDNSAIKLDYLEFIKL